MRYFDVHLHLPTPDEHGLQRLLAHLDDEPDLVGANLVLNTPAEVAFAYEHRDRLPARLQVIPYLPPLPGDVAGEIPSEIPGEFAALGWFKIHPVLHGLTATDIPALVERIRALDPPPRGLMVHCFPWGTNLQHEISLPLVIALATALPDTAVLATHGGGYESWAFRAHAGGLRNVHFDFSVSLSYYAGSDLLRPMQRYLRYSPDRLLFGSDWPSAAADEQLQESVRLADEMGVGSDHLEDLLLANAWRLWPAAQPRSTT